MTAAVYVGAVYCQIVVVFLRQLIDTLGQPGQVTAHIKSMTICRRCNSWGIGQTMKSLLLPLLLGLAAATSTIDQKAFQVGQEYLYSYDTQVVTGLPASSPITSGFRLNTHVRLHCTTATKFQVKFDRVYLYHFNQPVIQEEADENLVRPRTLTEMVGPEANTMIQILQTPFYFEYSEGHVIKIVVDKKETEWSTNIKRGFLSLFEVNLEKRFLVWDSPTPGSPKLEPVTDTYSVLESSPAGNCTTLYTTQSSMDGQNIFVTKQRDYANCLTRPVFYKSMFHGYFPDGTEKDKPLSVGASAKYSIKGNKDKFIIISAVAATKLSFSAYKNKGEVQSSVNQTLYLKDSHPISESKPILEIKPEDSKQVSLLMTLPGKIVDCKDPFEPSVEEPLQVSNPADVYPADVILARLKEAAANSQNLSSREALTYMRVIVDMLRSSPQPIIKQIWEKLAPSKGNQNPDLLTLKVFWNILTDVGTEAAADVVLDICNQDLTMRSNCSAVLNILTLKAIPSEKIINKIIYLVQSLKQGDPHALKQSAYLTLGSFGFKLSKARKQKMDELNKVENLLKSVKDKSQSTQQFVQEKLQEVENKRNLVINKYIQSGHIIVETLKKLVEEGATNKDRVLGLKALANSGLPQAFPTLKTILKNPSEPQFIRISAILGFRRFYFDFSPKQEAIKFLLNIYLDKKETNEIRSMAFIILTNLSPALPILEAITDSLNYEKDAHVSNLVLSWLWSYKNSSFYPQSQLIKNATSALKFAPKEFKGYAHSFTTKYSKMYDGYKMGSSVQLTSVGSMYGYEGWALNIDSYIWGLVSNFMEVGVNTEGMSQFLDKLFGPRGLLTSNKSLFDLLKRMPRQANPQEIISHILKEMKIKPRQTEFPAGHVYFKLMGHEINYFDFSDYLASITTQGKAAIYFNEEGLEAGLPIDFTTMMPTFDTALTLPTDAGLPMTFKLQNYATIKAKGTVQFKVNPYLKEEDRQGKPPASVYANVDIKPKAVVEMYAALGLDLPWVKPSTAFRAVLKMDMPIQNEVTFDLVNKKFKFVKQLPQQEKPVFEVQIEPYSEIVQLTNSKESPLVLVDAMPVFVPSGIQTTPIDMSLDLKPLGYKVKVSGQLPSTFSYLTPFRPLSGRTLVNVFLIPHDNAPATVTVQGQYVTPKSYDPASSYPFTYQDVLTSKADSSSSESNFPGQKFDKFGRPLPPQVHKTQPYSDPVDLSKDSINIDQLTSKFEAVTGKPVLFKAQPKLSFKPQSKVYGVILTLDASSQDIPRKAQFDSVWGQIGDGLVNLGYMRFWRSALPDYDSQEWQLVSKFGVDYPYNNRQVKDIFSPDFQHEVMKNLQFLVEQSSHQVANQILNSTVMSSLQQAHYPAMTRVPATRVLNTLIPEQLYKLWNQTGTSQSSKKWRMYWQKFYQVYQKIHKEYNNVVDPYFQNQDAVMFEYFTELAVFQNSLLSDLNDVISQGMVGSGELPVIQWLVYHQAQAVYRMDKIIFRDIESGAIQQVDKAKECVKKLWDNLEQSILKTDQIISTLSSTAIASQHPTVVSQPADSQVSPYLPSPHYMGDYSNPSMPQDYSNTPSGAGDSFTQLRLSLQHLMVDQSKMISKIFISLIEKKPLDTQAVLDLIKFTEANLTLVDAVFRSQPINDELVSDKLLLATVQNEFIVELVQEHDTKEAEGEFPDTKEYKQHVSNIVDKFLLKRESDYLAQRISSIYQTFMLEEVLVPELSEEEKPIYQQIQETRRNLEADVRDFEISLVRNLTAIQDQNLATAAINVFIQRMESHFNTLFEVQKNMEGLNIVPKISLVERLADVLTCFKYVVEYGRQQILAFNYPQRFTWIEALDSRATKVQTLISSMSAIFDKYVKYSQSMPDNSSPFPPLAPTNVDFLELQELQQVQEVLIKEVTNVLTDTFMTNAVQENILHAVLDQSSELQKLLEQIHGNMDTSLEQKSDYDQYFLAAVLTQAINKQRKIYSLVRAAITDQADHLQSAAELTQKLTSLEYCCVSSMETDLNQKLADLKAKTDPQTPSIPATSDYYSTYFSADYDPDMKTAAAQSVGFSSFFIPEGIFGCVNLTWGNPGSTHKTMTLQMMASRSMEQLLRIYRQTNAIVRPHDFELAINRHLADEPAITDIAIDDLNSFNHVHLVASFDKKLLPDWMTDYSKTAQEYIKYLLWKEYSQQPAVPNMDDGFLQIIFDLSHFNKKWDMLLMTSQETDKFQNIPLSTTVQAIRPTQNKKAMTSQLLSYISDNFTPAQCIIKKDKIQTFDHVTYQMPDTPTACRTLLAMDCSPEINFAVILTRSNSTYQGHVIQIINDDKVIEVIPDYLDVQVKVNNEVITLEEKKSVTFFKQLHYEISEEIVIISRQGQQVQIDLPLIGLYIKQEKSYISLQVSELYKKKICGLCGNFDGQISWEYEGPHQELHAISSSFVYSYILPEPSCPAYNPVPPSEEKPPQFKLNIPPPIWDRSPGPFPSGPPKFLANEPQFPSFSDWTRRPFRPKGSEPHYTQDDYDDKHEDKIDNKKTIKDSEEDERDEEKKKENKEDKKEIKNDNRDKKPDNKQKKTSDDCQPNQETDVKYRNRKEVTCFSKTPVLRCPMDCSKADKVKKEKVEYICLPSSDDQVDELKQAAASQGLVDSIADVRGQTAKRYVHQEVKCSPSDDQ